MVLSRVPHPSPPEPQPTVPQLERKTIVIVGRFDGLYQIDGGWGVSDGPVPT